MLVAVKPDRVITDFGFAGASTKERPLAESFFALRCEPNPRAPSAEPRGRGGYIGILGRVEA